MKKWITILLLMVVMQAVAQEGMRTMVTQGPVATGEPFQVQYVLGAMEKSDDFFPPDFKAFRVVNGPQFYEGQTYGPDGKLTGIRNVVYTLLALKPGQFTVPGASARVGGKMIRSKSSVIQVIDRKIQQAQERMLDDYYLKAGEDPYQKIRNNLFLKVEVNKRSCYVGQPVTAVFKLYSTLESRSDIVKNPGLYGFTVQDMIGLRENRVDIETVRGKKFDVHTIRKVQMYPLRAGTFQIDPMEVRNRVEFYKAIVPGKTEPDQTIREGVIEGENFRAMINTVVYESSMSTEAVNITVKPTPELARPDSFNGATGKFRLSAALLKKNIHTNEEGVLEVRISGEGNFTQLTAPEISWPGGVTAFDPEVKDQLDPETSPLKGERLFRYHFVTSKSGTHEIPAVVLSFFNPDSNRYQTLSSGPVTITVVDSVKIPGTPGPGQITIKPGSRTLIIIITVVSVLFAAVLYWFFSRRRKTRAVVPVHPVKPDRPQVRELLTEASMQVHQDDKQFYISLRRAIWRFFSDQFQLTGSQQGRNNLLSVMRGAGIDTPLQAEVSAILDHCEAGMFTDVSSGDDKAEWLIRTREVLEKIQGRHP